jgi:hypothetical protein
MATPTWAAMLWVSGLPTLRSWGTLRQATYPQLLHHAMGHDPALSWFLFPTIACRSWTSRR